MGAIRYGRGIGNDGRKPLPVALPLGVIDLVSPPEGLVDPLHNRGN
jgi:hypothetical protein